MSSKSENYRIISSPVFYRDCSRTIDRIWIRYLHPAEIVVVRFIFDRTIGWGKEWERIPMRHFTEGVFDKEGNFFGRTSLSESTVRRTLVSLEMRGSIRALRYKDRAAFYTLNFKWEPEIEVKNS